MKCMKKLVAVLLTAVMAMSLLTACGGGGTSGATNNTEDKGNELTQAINAKLQEADSSVQVKYDKTLSARGMRFYDAYTEKLKGIENPTPNQKTDARKAGWVAFGKDDKSYCWLSYDPTTYSFEAAGDAFAEMILDNEKQGYISKKIGYVTLKNDANQPVGMWAFIEEEYRG